MISRGGLLYLPITQLIYREFDIKVSKVAKIRNRYNQVPHLTQDTNGESDKLTVGTTNESQEVSPFPAGDHKAHINRRAQRHIKHKTEQNHKSLPGMALRTLVDIARLAFSKPCLINLISKDANLVLFYLSVSHCFTLQTSDYDVIFDFCVISSATSS